MSKNWASNLKSICIHVEILDSLKDHRRSPDNTGIAVREKICSKYHGGKENDDGKEF